MDEVWKVGFATSGLGAVAAFVVWSVYRQWLRLAIFQQMTKTQQYQLFRLIIVLTFLFGLATLAAYIFSKGTSRIEGSVLQLLELSEPRQEQFVLATTNLASQLRPQFEEEAEALELMQGEVVRLNQKRLAALRTGSLLLADEYAREIQALIVKWHVKIASNKDVPFVKAFVNFELKTIGAPFGQPRFTAFLKSINLQSLVEYLETAAQRDQGAEAFLTELGLKSWADFNSAIRAFQSESVLTLIANSIETQAR